MEDEFVSNKEHFTNTESSHIRLPHNIDCPGSRGGYLPISPEQMREMFERPVSRTCQLVREHIERCDRKGQYINYIFLVGGFGNSPYLKQRLELAVKQVRPSIEIIKPADAQQSVVLGALHTQLQRTKQEQNPVISTLARAHYGVLVMRPFNPLEHYPQERYIDPLTGEEFARHQIMWYIQKVANPSATNPLMMASV